MKVLVIKQVVGDDIHVVCVCQNPVMVSDVQILEGRRFHHDGNPYGVYGPVCERFTGRKWSDLTITVAAFTSGSMSEFVNVS